MNWGTNEWWIENQDGATIDIIEDECDMGRGVQIWNCVNTTVNIQGKVKGVTIVKCKHSNVNVSQTMAPLSMSSCDTVNVRPLKSVKFIEMSKCDSCHLILNQANRDAKLQTNFCSGIFMKFPKEGAEGDALTDENQFASIPITEMYESVIRGNEIVTMPVECLE
jgi:adenylyl cyclase-associated protein